MGKFYGKQVFKHKGELDKEIQKDMEIIQEKTMEKVFEELKKHIKRRVYQKDPLERDDPFYQRTEILLNIWEITKTYYHGGTYAGVYSGITVDNDKFDGKIDDNVDDENRGWQHTSHTYPFELTATDFVNIINNGVSASHSMFGEIPARPFWNTFLKIMDEKYTDLFLETASELGYDLFTEEGRGETILYNDIHKNGNYHKSVYSRPRSDSYWQKI